MRELEPNIFPKGLDEAYVDTGLWTPDPRLFPEY
jgi:hypothetical protein